MKANSLGAIFRAEKKLGRGDLFELITHFPDGSTKSTVFQHEFHDGLGALLEESRLWTNESFELPAFRLKSPASPLAIWEGVRGLVEDLRPSTTYWKTLNKEASYSNTNLAWAVLAQSSTATLREFSKNNKISLNSLLLFATNAVIAENLLAAEQENCRWLIPINMRRHSKDTRSTSNHTSSVGLNLHRSTELCGVERCYRDALNSWRVLAADAITRVAGMLSDDLLLKIAKRRGEKNSWIGSFSNLGIWNTPTTHQNWPIAVCIAPPAGTPCFPVGVGVITWQGSLSLSLRLHPGLVADNKALPERMLAEILKRVSQIVGGDLELSRSSSRSC